MLMYAVVERDDVPQTLELSEHASEKVKKMRSLAEQSNLPTDDLPVDANDDDDPCLKLDLRSLNQNVTPVVQPSATVEADSARTLADIPEDYLMSASARTTARDELSVEAGTQPVPASPRLDVAKVLPSSHTASVSSQSGDVSYDEDFSSAAASDSRGATSQRPADTEVLKQSAKNSQVSHDGVETRDDISEASSVDEMSASAVKSTHEASTVSTSSNAASPSKSAVADNVTAFQAPSDVAGKRHCYIMYK